MSGEIDPSWPPPTPKPSQTAAVPCPHERAPWPPPPGTEIARGTHIVRSARLAAFQYLSFHCDFSFPGLIGRCGIHSDNLQPVIQREPPEPAARRSVGAWPEEHMISESACRPTNTRRRHK